MLRVMMDLKELAIVSLAILLSVIFVPVLCSCTSSGAPTIDSEDSTGMLNSVLAFIKKNHPETSSLVPDTIIWKNEGRSMKPGYTSQVYTGGGWTVSIDHRVTAEPVYDIKAENINAGISWTGRIQNETILETGYKAR